jgi:regulator of protease activity HflC (stomatin/prohibitin superfamily)
VNGLFIFAIILAVITVALFGVGRVIKDASGATEGDKRGIRVLTWIFAVGALVTVFFCSFTPVGTRDIGVVTTFGKLAGHLSAGPNMIAPWSNETTIDGSYQPTDDSFTVRIAGGQTATAKVYVRWNATGAAADDIFANYKNTSGLEHGLLQPELNVAVNTVLDGYDPLTPISENIPAGTPGNPSTSQLGARIQQVLAGRVSPDIAVETLVLQPLVYDPTVQDRINSITNQVAKTDVAQQSEKTAAAQAAANQALEAGLVNNPLVLVQQCMTAIADGALKPPAGFSCWPGQGSGVVIPSASTTGK